MISYDICCLIWRVTIYVLCMNYYTWNLETEKRDYRIYITVATDYTYLMSIKFSARL